MMSKRAAKPTMAGAAIQALSFVWDEPVAVGLTPDAVTLEAISVAVVVTRTVTCDMVEDGVGGEFKEEAETDCAVIPLGDSVFDLGVHLLAGAL
jgi:hypothetical protein